MDGSSGNRPITSVLQLCLLSLSVALLQHIDLLSLNGIEFLALVLILAIPIAFYQLEFPLFQRRVVLDKVTKHSSHVRSLLWMAWLKKITTFLSALFGACLLLLLCHDLHIYYWYAFYAFSILLWLAYALNARFFIAKEVRAEHSGLIGRKINEYSVVAVLALIFVFLGYYYVGEPDLRGYSVAEVWSTAYREKFNAAENQFLAFFLAMTNALSKTTWYFVQIISTTLPDSGVKTVMWLLFLLPAALQAALMIRLQLGLLGMVEWKEKNHLHILGGSRDARLFFGVFFAIVIISALLSYRVDQGDLRSVSGKVAWALSEADPCKAWSPDQTTFAADELANISEMSARINAPLKRTIEQSMSRAYKQMDNNIDRYLDWYYSYSTQLKMQGLALWDWIATDDGEVSAMAMELNAKYTQYVLAPYTKSLARANSHFAQKANSLIEKELAKVNLRLEEKRQQLGGYQTDLCFAKAMIDLEDFDAYRSTNFMPPSKAGTGASAVVAAVAAKSAGKKLAASVAGKTAAKAAAKAGMSLSAKATTAGAAVASGASFGLLCGPAAPACALLGGVTTAILFEVAFNEGDEALTRSKTKHDIKMVLLNMSNRSRDAYIDAYQQYTEDAFKRLLRPNLVPADY